MNDEDSYAVIERVSTGSSSTPRIGRVVETITPKRLRVDWGTGVLEELILGTRYAKARVGSLSFLAYSDPVAFASTFDRDPKLVLMHVLAENRSALSARDVKKRLADLGLDGDAIERGWEAFRKATAQDGRVSVSSTSPRKYRFESSTDLPPLPEFAAHVPPAPEATASIRLVEEGPVAEPEVEEADGEQPTNAGHEHDRSDGAPIRTAQDLIARAREHQALVLDAAAEFDAIPPGEVSTALEGLEPNDNVFALIGCLSKSPAQDSTAFLQWIRSDRSVQTLGALLRRFPDGAPNPARLATLADRVAANHPSLSDLGLIAGIVGILAHRTTRTSAVTRERFVNHAADLVRRSKSIPSDQAGALARAISDMPWTAKRGRAGLVSAIAATGTDVSDEVWWSGFGWEQLRSVGDGSISGALRQPSVERHVVAPLVREALLKVQDRPSLGSLIGASRTAFEAVPRDALMEAVEQVASRDTLWRSVLERLRGAEQLAVSEQQIRQLQNAQAAAAAERDRLIAEVAQLRAQLDAAAEQVRMQASHERGLRESERRQAQLDAVRGLAQLAAFASTEAPHLSSGDLQARLDALTARNGITRFGAVGSETEYSPGQHDAPGARLAPGDKIHVVRPGYTWNAGDEPLVVVPALVRPI